jgi:hypothetical protein
MKKYIREWFVLSIVVNHSLKDVPADIVIADESAFLDPASLSGNGLLRQGKFLIILCSNGARRGIYTSSMDSDHVIEFVSKPCGPHRLARAILNCLDREVINRASHKERFDDFAPRQRAKSFEGSSPDRQTNVAGGAVANEGNADLPSNIAFSSGAINLNLSPGAYAKTKSRPAVKSSSNLSSESDLTASSSSPANSGNKGAFRNEESGDATPSSSDPSTDASDTKNSPEDSNIELSPAEGPPFVRPKMLLVEVGPSYIPGKIFFSG